MKKLSSLVLLVLALVAPFAGAANTPTVKLTVEVVTPDGKPVVGAEVGLGGGLAEPVGPVKRTANGITDNEGRYTAEIASVWGEVGAFARGDGYYENKSKTLRLSENQAGVLEAEKRGRWDPWERTIQIILRPVKNPAPMYAKRLISTIPIQGKPVGYDLAKGDWVAPFGQGEVTDFEFLLEGRVASRKEYHGKLTLRLPGGGNGIQTYELTDPNALQLFYAAPADGYAPTWTWSQSPELQRQMEAISPLGEAHPNRRFIFRVRSVLDAQGNVVSAWYGKIYGPGNLELRADSQWQIQFLYYLNPDATRNLEFDPKRNLFKDQKVTAP